MPVIAPDWPVDIPGIPTPVTVEVVFDIVMPGIAVVVVELLVSLERSSENHPSSAIAPTIDALMSAVHLVIVELLRCCC
jgi:hypothetical protein